MKVIYKPNVTIARRPKPAHVKFVGGSPGPAGPVGPQGPIGPAGPQGLPGSGTLAIGAAVTGGVPSRILQTNSLTQLSYQATWYFDNLAFGAGQPNSTTLRTPDAGGGYMASIGGGLILGRVDSGPCLFVGIYQGGGAVIPLSFRLGFAGNSNDHRGYDGWLERHAPNILKGAGLKARTYTRAGLAALNAADWIDVPVVCTDEASGRVLVMSDGTVWRRVSDNAIVS
jgi:hypothetical protein